METLNLALPDGMLQYVEKQVEEGGYPSASDYIRELIRADQREKARREIEAEVLRGIQSGPSTPMSDDDWAAIREQVRGEGTRDPR